MIVDSSSAQISRRTRVLVADDTDSVRALFQKLLTADGHEVISVEDGIEALDAIQRHRPDVILLDVGMPGLDGIEVCRRLKSDPETRLTPVVLVTGLSDLSDRIKGIEAGADDFLSKPVHPHELRARVVSLSRMKQLIDALDSAETLQDLRTPPGNRLEALKGDRSGQHSIRLNQQFRLCFAWTSNGPESVEIVDDH